MDSTVLLKSIDAGMKLEIGNTIGGWVRPYPLRSYVEEAGVKIT